MGPQTVSSAKTRPGCGGQWGWGRWVRAGRQVGSLSLGTTCSSLSTVQPLMVSVTGTHMCTYTHMQARVRTRVHTHTGKCHMQMWSRPCLSGH